MENRNKGKHKVPLKRADVIFALSQQRNPLQPHNRRLPRTHAVLSRLLDYHTILPPGRTSTPKCSRNLFTKVHSDNKLNHDACHPESESDIIQSAQDSSAEVRSTCAVSETLTVASSTPAGHDAEPDSPQLIVSVPNGVEATATGSDIIQLAQDSSAEVRSTCAVSETLTVISLTPAGHDAEPDGPQLIVSVPNGVESFTSNLFRSSVENFVTLDTSLIYSTDQFHCQPLDSVIVISTTPVNPVESESVNGVVLNAACQSQSTNLADAQTDTPSVSQLYEPTTSLSSSPVSGNKQEKKTVTRSTSSRKKQQRTPVSCKRNGEQASKHKMTLRNGNVVPYIREIPDHSDDSALSDSDDEDDERKRIAARNTWTSAAQEQTGQRSDNTPLKAKAFRSTWFDREVAREPDSVKFTGGPKASQPALEQLQLPADFFQYFFTDELLDQIVEQTTLYSVQKRPSKPLQCNQGDLKRFIGILLYMSLVRMSSSRAYWSADFRMDKIANAMTVNRFEELKRFLHFSDNNGDVDVPDKLRKIRPVVTALRCRCQTLEMDENLSLDEQIIPFKGRSGLKQYLPKKPHKWGYKVYVLSSTNGFSYDFELYTGKLDNQLEPGEPDCGASGNVVIRLSRGIPLNKNHKLYFDNYFCSPSLQLYLAGRGIHSLGTMRPNRIGLAQCNIPSEKVMKQRGRGTFIEKSTTVDSTSLSLVSWYDNRVVNFLSTFVGSLPSTEVRRWSKAENAFINVPCPNIVQVYNRHMGGVDLLDSLIGLYRSRLRSKKWYLRIFFHLIDMMIVNAWILYRECRRHNPALKSMRLHDFKSDVAAVFCSAEVDAKPKKRGRRPADDSSPPTKHRKCAPRPQDHLRTDGKDHWPEWCSQRGRCRRSGCKGSTRVRCSKCKTFICFTPRQNCFKVFHDS